MLPENSFLSLMLLAGLWLLLPLIPVNKLASRAMVLVPMIPVQIIYLHWRYMDTLEIFEFSAPVLWQYTFFVTEILVIVYTTWQCLTLIRFTDRTKQCDSLIISNRRQPERSVDLFIPTYSESRAILSETIAAAKTDNYRSLTIWICDDGNRDWLRKLCKAEKVRYLSRPASEPLRTKAANLHWCIPYGSGEYVVCLDADFKLKPEFITRITSFLQEPETGLVQAPQHFRNLDPVQRNLLGGTAWTEEQRFFFDIGLPSRDAWDNALCVGSCWACKRQIIDDLGGFPTDSIVEDVYFGYRVKSCGYKTVYLNECLATGLAAEDTPSYVGQRKRWCLGAINLLFDSNGPLRSKGLKLIDRVFYLELPFYWFTHIHLLLLLLAPAIYGYLGYNVFNCTTEELFTILIPKNILICTAFYWVSSGRCMPIVTPVQRMISLFHTLPAICQGLITPKIVKFTVTKKDIKHSGRTFHWRIATPFIIIGIMTVLATLKTFSQNYSEFYWSDYVAYNALLTAYSLITVFLCCLVCVDKPLPKSNKKSNIPLTGNWLRTSVVLSRRIFH